MNKKKLLIVMIILGIGIIILGGTLAYWNWHSTEEEKTNVVFTVTGTFSCAADGGGDITSSDVKLKPTTVSDATSGNYIKREVKVKPTITDIGKTIYMDLWLDINDIGTGLSNSDNFMYAFTTSSASPTDGVVVSGNFKDKTAGDKIELLSTKDYTATTTDTYYLWIWLDAKETNTSTMRQTFSLSLNGSCTDDVPLPKVYADLGDASEKYKSYEYVDKITKIEFVNNIDIPEGATTFELGTSPSESTDVMGWLIDDNKGNDTYILKIGANGRIYANSLAHAFDNMQQVEEIILTNLDTSETTNMESMFYWNSSLKKLDLSKFKTSNVTSMKWMFLFCRSLTELDLSSFDTSNNTSFDRMFAGCSGLTSLDVSNFDTSNANTMVGMFNMCSNLEQLKLGSKFETSNVTDMNYMFSNCANLTSLDVSGFDTSMVTDMSSMFYNCSGLTSLDVSNFNTSNVIDMTSMFASLTSLTSLDISNFDTSKVTGMWSMFNDSVNLEYIYVSNLWNTSLITDSQDMFGNCSKLPNYDSSVTDNTKAHYNTGGYLTYKAI